MERIDIYAQKALDAIITYGPRLLFALLTLWIGLKLVRLVKTLIKHALEKAKTEVSLVSFFSSLADWALKALLFISVASMIGIETTSFIAILGAAGLAVGLALQGTLANFAGGVLILAFRPYKVGDLVNIQGHFGRVDSIEIFVTKIITPDGKTIIIPNGPIANGNITNHTTTGQIRVDTTIGISYDSNIKLAKEILMKTVLADQRVLREPMPTVAVSELADSSVNLVVRPWCDPDVYWDVYFSTLENCKIALDAAGITIPFPQRDVHIIPQN